MEQYPTNEIRQEWAAWYLEDFRFAYKDLDGNDKLVHAILFYCVITNTFQNVQGMFKGPLVFQAFGAHWSAIIDAWKLEGIDDLNLPIGKLVGGLGLTAKDIYFSLIHTHTLLSYGQVKHSYLGL